MRPVALVLFMLLAGCAGAPAATMPETNATAPVEALPPTPPTSEAAVGERAAPGMERFVLLGDRTIGVLPEGQSVAEAKVAEPLPATAFFSSQVQPAAFVPFVSTPFRVPFETTGEFEIALRFVASAPAATAVPAAGGLPPIGAWFGTPERAAFFLGAADLPPTLEANKVYTAVLRVPLPPGGFFVREGETISLTPYSLYQVADGSSVSWVVGGEAPSGFLLPHAHFELRAPRAIPLLDEQGETGPNPGFSGDENQEPANIPFTVPADALYVVLEVTGGAKAGTRIDIDGSIRTAGGEVLAGGSGPNERETVVIGPSALAAAGRELVAHVTSSASASGGTFSLKVTAYAP